MTEITDRKFEAEKDRPIFPFAYNCRVEGEFLEARVGGTNKSRRQGY